MTSSVKSVCPYCGVGCGLVLHFEDGRIAKVTGDKSHPANFGRLCTKGLTSAQALTGSGRMAAAYLRQHRQAAQMPVAIDAAIAEAARRLRAIIDAHGPDAIAFYVSGQMSLEAQYLANKLAKGFVGTNNIDSNSRLCMSSAASGYKLSLGADGPPGSYQDFDQADVFFVAGANMADCHPILFLRLLDRVKAGAKLIVVDPRRTATAEKADLHLQLKPGTDLALLNGLLHLLVVNERIDRDFIGAFTEGWDAMPAFLADYTPARVAALTGLAEADIVRAAQWIGDAGNWMSCWTMGLNQSTHGTWATNAICNLHLATGAICRPGSGPFSLTGQPNAMGGREVGYLSAGLPGQRAVTSAADRAFSEALWGVAPGSIRAEPGPDAVTMFERLAAGAIKAVWIICTNPIASLPNRQAAIAGLQAAELVITQDAFLHTETNMYADIMLPGALWAEAAGVMINSERNLSLMNEAVAPPGEARADWRIIADVARAMGFDAGFEFASAAEVFEEIRSSGNPQTGYDIAGASHARLTEGPLQWPCPAAPQASRNPVRYLNDGLSQSLHTLDDGSRPRLAFPTESRRAQFLARPALPPAELPDADYPFVLNTGRLPHQWHTMTKTGKIPTLNKLNPGPFVELHPDDAAALGVTDQAPVEIRSRRGRAVLPASLSPRVLPGGCFVPFHWNDVFGEDLAINAVTSDATDAISFQPGFKFCAVALARVAPAFPAHRADDADTLAAALDLPAAAKPDLSEAETIYVAGFIAGLRMPGARGDVPCLPADAPVAPATRLWLNGLLAGLYSRVGAPPPMPPAAAGAVTVLFASQTGNAEALAEKLTETLRAADMPVRLSAMADYPAADLGGAGTVILISSTYGDGEAPDNGRDFWDVLRGEDAPRLDGLTYAVCALGDSTYDQFAQHGKNLDARLAALGATRLRGRFDCDAGTEPAIDEWIPALAKQLGGMAAPAATTPPAPTGWSKNNPYPARLLASVQLNPGSPEKDTRFIAISLAGADITYEAGDSLGVWPSNCPALVDEVLARAGLQDDAMVTVDKAGHLPLRQALLENFELTRPGRETLEFIAERSHDTGLKSLLAEARKAELKQWLWGKQLPDVLAAFPIKTSAQEFVAALKHIQPRNYSIASSPRAHAGEVHLTVAAVRYGAGARKGVCSTFLADRCADAPVPVFVQPSSHFHLPPDPSTPVIMIGPGTGIAPFRGFLHDRRATGATGRNWLFFGERHAATDFYYKDELLAMQADGFLTLSLAFSRDQAAKRYVQHCLTERGDEVWAWLQAGAVVYVCGDAAQMAKDVEAALLAVAQAHGGMNVEAAQAFLRSLARGKRYLRDIY
jgi:NADPH-dependent sulfite reductase flavoprotein alpha-component